MDLKKLTGQAGQLLTRAVQFTEEKLGNVEKTEFDSHYQSLVAQFESTRIWTEKILSGVETILIPNPGNRVEDMLFEKMDKKKPNRLSNFEYLGLDMVQAGNLFGSGTSYGSALLKVGGVQQRLGFAERQLVNNGSEGFIQPLQKFLDTEVKTITRERRVLDTKRLDLDACKNRLRKAKTIDSQIEAENDLLTAQLEFDHQIEITRILLEGIQSSQVSHLKFLNDLVEAQVLYYKQSHKIMIELQQELAGLSLNESSSVKTNEDLELTNNEWIRAKVVCDYDATSKQEVSLKMNEEIVFSTTFKEADFVLVKKGASCGKVPRAYLEILSD